MRVLTSCRIAVLSLLALSSALSAQAQTESPLPAPTGRYAIGRTHFDWADVTRPDTASANGHRIVSVWVWYPAAPTPGAQPAEWLPGQQGERYWSNFVRRYPDAVQLGQAHPIGSIRTHAYVDAPVAPGTASFPLLLFAPGLGSGPLEYSNLIEDVVSHGYVVAGIVPNSVAPPRPPRPDADPADRDRFLQANDDIIQIWAADLGFALDQMGELNANANAPLHGRIAMNAVGAFGHSMGAAASLKLGNNDPRVRAVFEADGNLTLDVVKSGLPKPVLVFGSDVLLIPGFDPKQAAARNPLADYDRVLQKSNPGYHLRLSGSMHMFSADIGSMPFVPSSAKGAIPAPSSTGAIALPLVGPINPVRALAITKSYVEAFFDQYLLGTKSDLLSGPSPEYPEVVFEYPAPARGGGMMGVNEPLDKQAFQPDSSSAMAPS